MIFYWFVATVLVFLLGVYLGWCIGWRERGEASDIKEE